MVSFAWGAVTHATDSFLVQVNERVYQTKTIKSLLSSIIDGERL